MALHTPIKEKRGSEKVTRRRIPLPQHVSWRASGEDPAGLRVWNVMGEYEEFIPWNTLKVEFMEKLLSRLFADPNGFIFSTQDHYTKKDWLVQVLDSQEKPACNVWLGGDPDNGWAFDGLIRIGSLTDPPVIWQTYQRYSDGSYRRLKSRYGAIDSPVKEAAEQN